MLRGGLAVVLGVFFLGVADVSVVRAQEVYPEYRVKAAFLLNFTRFVEWPPEAFPHRDTPYTVCIVGPDPFGTFLDESLRNRSVAGRRVVARRLPRLDGHTGCHILFVGFTDEEERRRVLQRVSRAPILTVGDGDDFTDLGGCIGLLLVDRRVRLEINVAAAQWARLQISSKLLKLARIVGGTGEERD